MSSKLNIATIPLKIAWADREENLLQVAELMSKIHRDTDIVVLPEMFSTGYVQDRELVITLAEPVDGRTMTKMKELARVNNMAVAGSFLCREGDNLFNRGFFIEPSGETTFYDKRHLFSLSSEQEIFTPGVSRSPIVRYRGWNIALIVCYDLRFPVWCRNIDQKYDLMLVPANWPVSRGYAWNQLIIARAIENQAVYVGANRGGSDDFGDYDGLSIIVDGAGKPIGTPDEATGIIYATADLDLLRQIRTKLPFGKDADDFALTCMQLPD